PSVVVHPERICYVRVGPSDAEEIVRAVKDGSVVERLLYEDPSTGKVCRTLDEIPFYSAQQRMLMAGNVLIDPLRIEDYIACGGYSALAKALSSMSPEAVIDEVMRANLRGRGGGGFPAARKWQTARNAPGDERYVIVNAHEGEPGAYMDRAIFTGNPHMVLEGLIIGAYAIGASRGFIYTRHDNPRLKQNIDGALEAARELGLLGENILGSGFDFDVEVHYDIGIFVSGESSALMRSLEGRNPEPRPKYVRTSVSGVWGKPTNLNNVETWANVPFIIDRGADWYASIGTEHSKGTKLISLSGSLVNKGVVEVPFGTPLRKIVYEMGGGCPEGRKVKAIHFGGPMGGSIPESLLDTPLDFDAMAELGAPIGAGALMVFDEETSMVDVGRYFVQFLVEESCGKCVPCREGLRQMQKVMDRLSKGQGKPEDLELLDEISEVSSAACLCALGRSACDPLESALKYFRDEYRAAVEQKAR
ncbi:MAG: NADH-quinone oxidoreductase subunit F, partial [Deltaproteobacteria bacterium]